MGWNYSSISKLQRLHSWSLGKDKQFHPTFYNGSNFLSMPGLKLIHVGKGGHRQLYEWFSPSVCLPHLHVVHYVPSSYHHHIFSSYCHWQKWCPCKRLKSGVKGRGYSGQKQILPQSGRFRTVTLVWIHAWLRNVMSNFKVIRNKKSPLLSKIGRSEQ